MCLPVSTTTVVCESAQSAAARPARLPNVIVSMSAFPPRRLAPWTETQAHSPGRVETLERSLAVEVGLDAAHVVVSTRPDGDRVVDRIDAGEHHRELPRPVQALDDLLRAQVAQVEEDVPVHAAPVVDLRLLRARDDVAARELHRVGRVVLEEPVAVRVEQVRALTPGSPP